MDQISNFKKSIPDGERFLQEPLSQYSYWRANAYIGGQNPLTWEGIYQVHHKQGDEEDLAPHDPDELDEEDTWETEEFEDEEEE